MLEVKLTSNPTEEDKKQPGYQPPLPIEELEKKSLDEIIRFRRKGGRDNS